MNVTWSQKPFFIEVAGQRLEGAGFGPAPDEAPTLVLLHEGLGSLAQWRDIPQALVEATGWGVFAYSRAGYGQSDPVALPRPLDYMTHEAVEVLPAVLDAIGFQNGVLIGHSDGASIAAIYAGSVIDHRVRGITLLAPHFFIEEIGLSEIAKVKRDYESGDLRQALAKYHRDADNAFYGWNNAWLDPEFKNWDISEVIDYLRIPTLAIQGEADPYGTLAQIDILEERSYAPVDRLVIESCGHAPLKDARPETISAVCEFVMRLARIEAAKPIIAA